MKESSRIKVAIKLNSKQSSKYTINQFKNTLLLNETQKLFKFDYIIDNTNNIELIDDFVNIVINGKNSCIVCHSYNINDNNIFKITIDRMYSLMMMKKQLKHVIKVSCVEINNEKMIDLLDDSGK